MSEFNSKFEGRARQLRCQEIHSFLHTLKSDPKRDWLNSIEFLNRLEAANLYYADILFPSERLSSVSWYIFLNMIS